MTERWLTSARVCEIVTLGRAREWRASNIRIPGFGLRRPSRNAACARGLVLALSTELAATRASAQEAFADPAGSGPIVNAVAWLQGTLLGTVATVVAIIAVASVGFLMLTGRMNWRYGATVILGCFVLFGAAAIVSGIRSTAAVGY